MVASYPVLDKLRFLTFFCHSAVLSHRYSNSREISRLAESKSWKSVKTSVNQGCCWIVFFSAVKLRACKQTLVWYVSAQSNSYQSQVSRVSGHLNGVCRNTVAWGSIPSLACSCIWHLHSFKALDLADTGKQAVWLSAEPAAPGLLHVHMHNLAHTLRGWAQHAKATPKFVS